MALYNPLGQRFGRNIDEGFEGDPYFSEFYNPNIGVTSPTTPITPPPTNTTTQPGDQPPTTAGLKPWEQIFSELDIPTDYLELLTNPTAYWPEMTGYETEFQEADIARGSLRAILDQLLGTGEGSIAEAESQRTALVTGAYGTGATAAEQAKFSGLGTAEEIFRRGEQRATVGGTRDVRGTRGAARLARLGTGFTRGGAIGEEERFGVGETVKQFQESILGLTTGRSQTETDILNRFGTTMEQLERTQTGGMYNVRDVIEQMRGGGSDALMALINQYIGIRDRIVALEGGNGGNGFGGDGKLTTPPGIDPTTGLWTGNVTERAHGGLQNKPEDYTTFGF